MNNHIKHIVASGCSQSSDGIGGIPLEGCSFLSNCGDVVASPGSWVSFLAQNLAVSSLVNLAAHSHGNILIANSIIETLSKFNYPQESTLVIFNVSWPTRLDVMCDWDDPNKSNFIPWDREFLPYSYLYKHSRSFKKCERAIGIDQIERMSWLALVSLFNFLENNHYNYKFLLAGDFVNSEKFYNLLLTKSKNLIMLDSKHQSIAEFVRSKKLNADEIHPTVEGHKLIADIVLENIKELA